MGDGPGSLAKEYWEVIEGHPRLQSRSVGMA